MIPSADITFLITMAGLGAVVWELARPGLVLPGVLGAGLLATAAYFVWQRSPQPSGLLCLLVAALLFSLELSRNTHLIGGALGTIALCCGFGRMFGQPGGIDLWLALPFSLLFGAAVVWLAGRARRGRWNKAIDI